ncbi:polysaccharide biosynthesis protein, partial [Kosakonia sp. H7A]|uniref:hypothetical protein n=1 Tax=Kosakonia sp. H7A TaxID=2054598 RepID=UPI000D46B341
DENYRPTLHPKILEADARQFPQEQVLQHVARLREAVDRYDMDAMEAILGNFLPDFSAARDTEGERSATVVPFPAREVRRI